MDGLERISLIGTGSFGKVYKCRDVNSGKFVAAKEINLDANEDCFDVLRGEIVALLACAHPNIIRYHRSFIPKQLNNAPASPTLNRLCIVMDYCELGSLRQIIDTHGPLPEKIVAEVAESILSALEYLHRQGISHRDLKAANIFVDAGGCIKLGDFGVALTEESKLDKLAGSPYWMAPEVIKESRYPATTGKPHLNPASADLWSFAITLIELLKGRPPLHYLSPSAAMGMIPSTSPPRLESSDPHASRQLRELIHACLHDDPKKRPTAKELLKQYKSYFKSQRTTQSSILEFLRNTGSKDSKASKDIKDSKESKDIKERKDSKESKDGKDGKDSKDSKDSKDESNKTTQSSTNTTQPNTQSNTQPNNTQPRSVEQNFSTVLSGWDFEIGSTMYSEEEEALQTLQNHLKPAESNPPTLPGTPRDAQAVDFSALTPFHDRPTPKFALRSVNSDSLSASMSFTSTRLLDGPETPMRSFKGHCNWTRKDQSILPIPPPLATPDLSRPQYEIVAQAGEADGKEKQILRLMRLYLTEEERRPQLSLQLRHLL